MCLKKIKYYFFLDRRKKKYEFLFCRIGVGKSFYYLPPQTSQFSPSLLPSASLNSGLNNLTFPSPPSGFDSLFIGLPQITTTQPSFEPKSFRKKKKTRRNQTISGRKKLSETNYNDDEDDAYSGENDSDYDQVELEDETHSISLMSSVSKVSRRSRQSCRNTPYATGTAGLGLATNVNDTFEQNYCLFDSSQVLPLFLLRFEYNPADDEKGKIIMCSNCETNRATVYCVNDDAYLCHDCDDTLHSVNKLVFKHSRRPIEEQEKAFANCPSHQSVKVEFFCPTCGIPVCVHCKMVGSHSNGEAAIHKLVPILDAYRSVLEASRQV
jgi:hypothetical protein